MKIGINLCGVPSVVRVNHGGRRLGSNLMHPTSRVCSHDEQKEKSSEDFATPVYGVTRWYVHVYITVMVKERMSLNVIQKKWKSAIEIKNA